MAGSNNTTATGKFRTILWLGLLTGTLDAIAAMIWARKAGAALLFKSIASGMFGKAAFAGGTGMILWGLLFHFIIAYSFTAVLFMMYPSFARILKNKYVIAVVFALITWLITNLVIVPLSQIGWQPLHVKGIMIGFGILIFTIGLPVALVAERAWKT